MQGARILHASPPLLVAEGELLQVLQIKELQNSNLDVLVGKH